MDPQRSPSASMDDDKKSLSGNGNANHQAPLTTYYAEETGSIKQTTGVSKMEAVARIIDTKQGRRLLYGCCIAVYACNWVYAMEGSTTYSYAIWATSDFGQHSGGLASLQIATGIISSVCTPFLARFSDVFGRPWVYALALFAYIIGFIMIAFSPTITCYIIGNVLTAIAGAAISLLNSILTADLVPLKWRGLAQGILATPYLATVWYTSSIAQALGTSKNWRWGYGMYCIIMPVVIGPAIVAIVVMERKARKLGLVDEIQQNAPKGTTKAEAEQELAREEANAVQKTWKEKTLAVFHELDTVGLLLLAFGWSLILLPFSLAGGADGGYANRSLIAMFVVGAVCLLLYAFWEIKYARYPTAPARLFKNKTFINGMVISFMYLLAGYCQLTYIYSYTYIVTDFNDREQNYYNNVLTMGLCSFGVFAGLAFRYTHRYKLWQILGLIVKILGMGLFVSAQGVRNEARLIIAQFLVGAGGAVSVVANQVSTQACVPHQDVALVISLLGLWSAIGSGIGSAIAAAVWQNNLPGYLRQFVPATIDDATLTEWYGNIILIKAYPLGSPEREGAIQAYVNTIHPLFSAALGLSFIPLIAACFQTNYYLGDSQNAITNTDTAGRPVAPHTEKPKPTTFWGKVARCWDL